MRAAHMRYSPQKCDLNLPSKGGRARASLAVMHIAAGAPWALEAYEQVYRNVFTNTPQPAPETGSTDWSKWMANTDAVLSAFRRHHQQLSPPSISCPYPQWAPLKTLARTFLEAFPEDEAGTFPGGEQARVQTTRKAVPRRQPRTGAAASSAKRKVVPQAKHQGRKRGYKTKGKRGSQPKTRTARAASGGPEKTKPRQRPKIGKAASKKVVMTPGKRRAVFRSGGGVPLPSVSSVIGKAMVVNSWSRQWDRPTTRALVDAIRRGKRQRASENT